MDNAYRHIIVEEDYFRLQLKRIQPDAKRADEFIDGVKWVLSRDPTMGIQVSDTVWFIAMADSPENISVNLYYTFNESHVYFLAIEIAG